MTKKELEEFYFLKTEIQMWQQELKELKAASLVSSPELNAVRGTKFGNKIESLTAKLVMIENKIKEKTTELLLAREKINNFILSISDSRMRVIISSRVIELNTWNQIADKVGGTECSVKKAYYRYLKKSGIT